MIPSTYVDTMAANDPQQPGPELPPGVFVDRRGAGGDRRQSPDRRVLRERRSDRRLSPERQPKSLRTWVRSLVHARLGVDRRKQGERRMQGDRRRTWPSSLLTKEELHDLLSD